ncbi:Nup93/Nic96-domain-containing protein [Cryomyces antarcticus]
MSNVFGSFGQSKPATSSSFGNLGNSANTSSQQGSSIFGAAPSNQPQQQSGGPFSSLSGTPQQQSTPSLFDRIGTSQPQKAPSLFDRIGTSQPQQQQTSSGGLFSNLGASTAQPQQQGTSGLFGSSGTTQPQQQSSNLFGNLGTGQSQPEQATSGSLFGGLGASSQPAAQKPSLFGSLGGTSQPPQQQQTSTGSLFGGSTLVNTQNQQPQQENGQVPQNGAPASQPAYFDHLLERGKKRQNQENGGDQFSDLPSLQLGLGDIARKVRNLGAGGPTSQQARGADSRAHYLLAASGVPTGSALRDLKSFGAETGVNPIVPASAPYETDTAGYVAKLQAKSTLDLIAEGLEQSKRDFDTFLEENVQMEWDAQRKRIYEHFGLVKNNLDDSVNGGPSPTDRGTFGRSARKSRGLGASTKGMSFGTSGMSRSVIGAPASRGTMRASVFNDVAEKVPANGLQPAPEDRFLRDKQEKFAEKVKQLNVSRLGENVYTVLQHFAEVESQPGNDNAIQLTDSYKALIEITGENADVQRPSDPGAIKERHYAQDYLDEALNSRNAIKMRKRIIDGARQWLEKDFYNKLQTTISRNPREANLGGVPTTINRIRAYVRVRAARKELGADSIELQTLGDDYCWVLIFYLLRSGLVREAAQYVAENERAIKSMDRNFPQYMASYATDDDRRLSPELQNRISSEYQQRSRLAPENSLDPYRMACYKIVGRCELSRRTLEGMGQSVEDWIWLQFNLAREVNRVEETAGEVFGLEELRGVVLDIGQRHFLQGGEASSGYGTYFFLQILAGMFEQAVAYLYGHNYISAIHFAIALDFYGLLRVSDFAVSEDLLTYTTRQKPQISFGRMLGIYTQDFRLARATAATDYLTLICLNADLPGALGKSQKELCHEALRELVLETREFAQLLGDIRSDGQRIKGAIEQRLPLLGIKSEEEFLRDITMQAAQVADDSGRTTDAVLLYHLAEEYDNVTVILNRALSEALAVDLGQEHMRLEPLKPRENEQTKQGNQQQQSQQPQGSLSLTSVDDPVVLAQNMIGLYNSNAMYYKKIRSANRDACGVLLQMSKAKSRAESGKWPEAIDVSPSTFAGPAALPPSPEVFFADSTPNHQIITGLKILPMEAHGNVTLVRATAQSFSSLQPVLARNVPGLLMWTITCCGRQRDALRSSAFEDRTRAAMAEELLVKAKDLMVFAGLVRYKLPPRVFEVLARAGQDLGAY